MKPLILTITSHITLWLLSFIMLIGLPLLGLTLYGADIQTYLEFPPLTRYVVHAPFNAAAFAIFCVVDGLMVLGVIYLFRQAQHRSANVFADDRQRAKFPPWGWLGVTILTAGWVLAWTRFPWFAPLQAHTFSIPWVGYILVVNALCVVRSGRCLLTDTPVRFLLLWPVSALFWWFFEYLNRFVQNWYYVGGIFVSPIEYIFHASLAFATVLPAVLSTHRLLLTFPIFNSGLKSLIPLSWVDHRYTALLILIIASLGLTFIGKYSDHLYPLVWGAPLLVITSLQTLWGKSTIFTGLTKGDWRALISSALAALICGFFWELWNYYSLARWEYAIPCVDCLHIFAMPLLGYGGYLPFGFECLLVGKIIIGNRPLKITV